MGATIAIKRITKQIWTLNFISTLLVRTLIEAGVGALGFRWNQSQMQLNQFQNFAKHLAEHKDSLNVCIVSFAFSGCFPVFALNYDLLRRRCWVGPDERRRSEEGGR